MRASNLASKRRTPATLGGSDTAEPRSRRLFYGLAAVVCAVLTGCHPEPPPTPLNQLNAQQIHGYQVFRSHCGRCHYDRRSGGLHGPSMLGVFKSSYLPGGGAATDERVTAIILHGHGLMPAQRNIDPQDLNDLLAYLHTL